jgi:hypothetical protein
MNCVYIVKVEAIHSPLFVFKNYGSFAEIQTNHSVPCHKGDGGNTLATRYNHNIFFVDDTYWYGTRKGEPIYYAVNLILRLFCTIFYIR